MEKAERWITPSFENTRLEDSPIPQPDPEPTPKNKYEKIVVPVPLSEVMTEEEAQRITEEERISSLENSRLEPPSMYQDDLNKCKQSLSTAIDQIKQYCRNVITQFPSDSSGFRKAKQKCRDEFGDVPDVEEYLDTFKSTSKKKSEIQRWLSEINNECGGKLDKALIILDYILRNRLSRRDGYKISKGQKVTIGNKNFDCVIFYKDKAKMLSDLSNNGLKIGSRQLDRYIRWFLKQGIVLRTNKNSSRGESVYCIGYWSDSKDKEGQKHENPITLYRVKAKHDQYDKAFRNFSLEK